MLISSPQGTGHCERPEPGRLASILRLFPTPALTQSLATKQGAYHLLTYP